MSHWIGLTAYTGKSTDETQPSSKHLCQSGEGLLTGRSGTSAGRSAGRRGRPRSAPGMCGTRTCVKHDWVVEDSAGYFRTWPSSLGFHLVQDMVRMRARDELGPGPGPGPQMRAHQHDRSCPSVSGTCSSTSATHSAQSPAAVISVKLRCSPQRGQRCLRSGRTSCDRARPVLY